MMKTSTLFFSVILLVQFYNGFKMVAQDILTLPQLREDFLLFRTALEEAHPGIYRYETKSSMDGSFEAIEKELHQPLNQQEFYKILNPVLAKIGCGHTKLIPSEDNDFMYYYNTETLFPLKLFLDRNKAYVRYSYDTGNKLEPGTEIMAINGIGMEEIIHGLLNNLFSDGQNQTFKYYELNRYFNALFSNFYLEEGKANNKFSITYKDKKRKGSMELDAISSQRIREIDAKTENSLPYELDFKNANTALMTIRTFWPNGEKYNFEAFLKESFVEINDKNIENLILDLRGNEGGKDAFGSLLLSYLVNADFRYYDKLVVATNEKFSFVDHAQLPEGYDELKALITQTEDGEFRWEHNGNLTVQTPQEHPFKGQVYVLIDGACFSVTSEFCAVASHLDRVSFIGEETGGGYYGNNSGAFAIVTLPNSKMKLGIPLMAYYTAVKDYEFTDRGIMPDHPIRNTIKEVLTPGDEVLDWTLGRINKK
ncbi:S41 family peptidase [Arenibacter sp. F20364]|uniref:S41 family peptidase n=1 Tax=Arenibacter sp. F20364 TaxID=2926415 RepID=UPI001FF59716|nr:S41 family peptidase [Arenibacter sp. F20364]MCK0191510.1 S41 family peptidase [Arenibacter sp. F20364]